MARGFYARTSGFALALDKFAQKFSVNADALITKVIIDSSARIVERSPVGDGDLWEHPPPKGYIGGRFRGNWQYGNYGGAGIPVGTLSTIDPTGALSMNRIIGGIPRTGAAGMRHIVINNLPYGQRLEDGWSSQAPAGMVALTVMEFQQFVADAVKALP